MYSIEEIEHAFREIKLDQNGNHNCPFCGKPSVLSRGLDRFIHLDGSENRKCWRAITREIFSISGSS